MNLSFNGNELYKGFNLVTSIVPSTAIKHILRGIRVEAQPETGLKPVCNCVLKSGKGFFKIAGEDSSQFPMTTITDVKSFVEVDGGIIGEMIGKVIHAASKMKARSTLCGVFVKIGKE